MFDVRFFQRCSIQQYFPIASFDSFAPCRNDSLYYIEVVLVEHDDLTSCWKTVTIGSRINDNPLTLNNSGFH